MICGFLNDKIVSAEEYLIDYSIRTGQLVHIPTDLLNIPITFDGNDINAFILDITNNNDLVLQLALPLKDEFDKETKVYKTSYIRELLNSTQFLNRFNSEFVDHIKQTKIYAKSYMMWDKMWLLSHEEINLANTEFLERNKTCKAFDAFKHIDLKSYTKTLLNLNPQTWYGWWLRSACKYTKYYINTTVAIVNGNGYVDYDLAYSTSYGAVLPACIIG